MPATRIDGRPALDLDGIDAAFRAGGELLVLTNPHNPLGRVFTADELRAVCAVVDRHGGRVFADEIHAPLTYPGHEHVPYAALSPTAAGTPSPRRRRPRPGTCPGSACGQLILSNDADRAAFAALPTAATHGTSPLAWWPRPRRTAWRPVARRGAGPTSTATGRPSRDLLAEHLPDARFDLPEGTYLAWLDLRALGLGDHPAGVLPERTGVALVDGPLCGAPGRGHARLNFATPRPILAEMVRRLGAAVRRRPPRARS